MTLLVAAPTYLPSRRANTVQVMKMTQALAQHGFQPHLLVPRPPGAPTAEWHELAHHYGLQQPFPIQWLPVHPRWRSYDYTIKALRAARHLGAGQIYTRHPQIAAFSSFLGMPTLHEVHDLPKGIGNLWFRLFLAGKGARRLVVITRALWDDLAQRYPVPAPPFTLLAPDGVDLARYTNLPTPAEARAQLGLPPRFTAGYTGHLYAGRGSDLLLELAARLPEIHFLLVGGNPQDVQTLKQRAAQLKNVTLTGFVPNADLPRYQTACECLLMPYSQKIAASSGGDIARYLSPMKLFEYLACGRVILSADLPVLREILNPQNAVLLPPDDVQAWQTALQNLINDPKTELAQQAARTAQNYTWLARAAQIMAEA